MEKTDVLIIGAGPAGACAGIVLAQKGVDVMVVDKAHFPRPKTCGDALSNNAVVILGELGVENALKKVPHSFMQGAVAVLPDGSRIVRDYGTRPGLVIPRLHLDNILVEHLRTIGGNFVEGIHVRELKKNGQWVCGAQGDNWSCMAKAVLLADGHGSISWLSEAQPFPSGRFLGLAATMYMRGVEPLRSGFGEHFFDSNLLRCGYGWIFPPVEGIANVGVFQRADCYHADGVPLKNKLEKFVSVHMAGFKFKETQSSIRTWALPLNEYPRPSNKSLGLLILGDAGRFVDPLSGEGIWQALHTGRLAANITLKALDRGEGLNLHAQQQFQRACAKSMGISAIARSRIQDAMNWMLQKDLYQRPLIRKLLQLGYGGGFFEMSKG